MPPYTLKNCLPYKNLLLRRDHSRGVLRSALGDGPALSSPLPLTIKKQFCEGIRIAEELLRSSTATSLLP